MDKTALRGDSDDELEDLVMHCLDAADPRAELDRRTADRPDLRDSAWLLIQQVGRLEQNEPVQNELLARGHRDPDPADRSTWPSVPDVELEALVGRGGQGFVFRGRQTYLDRRVAVKVLAAEWRTPPFLARFRREARMLAGLQHPHIVTCHAAGLTASGECFLVMEYIDGPSLKGWLERHGRLPLHAALRAARDLAAALDYARQNGLVHRDVKPENVLLQPQDETTADPQFPFTAKLADLGLARPLQRSGPFTMLTPIGAIVGTPGTMAPEQLDAPEQVDHRADIYGLGCVLYHALAGKPAFRGTAMTELVLQKAAMRGTAALVVSPDVPASVTALVARMLAYSPEERPQTYQALLAELDALLPSEPVAPPARRRFGVALAAFLGIVVVGTAAVSQWFWNDRARVMTELLVAAPAKVVEGATVVISAASQGLSEAADAKAPIWSITQTRGAHVRLQEAAAGRWQFVVPRGIAGGELAFAITAAAAAGTSQGTAHMQVDPDPAAASLAPGTERALFVAVAGDAMALWTGTDPKCWQEEPGRGALVNSPRGATEARLILPRGAFTLRGRIEPRYRYESAAAPRVPIAALGLRLLFADDDAFALVVAPVPDGTDRFRAALQRQQREADGGWRNVTELAAVAGQWPDTDPLQFTLAWTGTSLRCTLGTASDAPAASGAAHPADDWQVPWLPGQLELHADRGVAVFTDWVLAAAVR